MMATPGTLAKIPQLENECLGAFQSLALAALALQGLFVGTLAGDIRGARPEETLLSAEGDVAAATDEALSEVHSVKAIERAPQTQTFNTPLGFLTNT